MTRDWGAINKRLLAQKAQIAETTVQNILGGVNQTRIDMVDRLAGVFKLPAWRLLKPDVLEADQERISDEAMEIGQLFDKLPGDRRPRAHTLHRPAAGASGNGDTGIRAALAWYGTTGCPRWGS